MNTKHLFQLLSAGILVLLTACQGTGQSASAMLKAGDNINGISLATGPTAAAPLWAFCSSSQESSHIKTFNCRVPVLPTLAIGHIFLLVDEAYARLDGSKLVWELSIDNQAVDLDSFESFSYSLPSTSKHSSSIREVVKKATAWNILLTSLNPGEHTLRFLAKTDADSYRWLVHLVIEGKDGTDISSVPFPPKF